MEHLFSPCTRLLDILENYDALVEEGEDREDNFETAKELNLDISTEEFLRAERAFTYADLYAMIEDGDTLAWLTPHAAVVRVYDEGTYAWEQLEQLCFFCFSVDGKEINAFARSHEHLLEICDVVLRLLAAGVAHSVILSKMAFRCNALINATSLEYLMEQCQSLNVLRLEDVALDENHCRVLGTYSRKSLQIELERCRFTGTGAETLCEVLQRNQGPTELVYCKGDNFVLADGLRGNSRLKRMRVCAFDQDMKDVSNQDLLAISSALKENKGLVHLRLWYDFRKSDGTWGAICDSLATHPTLEVLELGNVYADASSLNPSVITSRLQALLDMIKGNRSIHKVRLDDPYDQHEIFRGSVIPHLETNRLRPRILAIQTTRPIMYRAKVLGRALLAARTDHNSFWMLLAGNPEVACLSTTVTTTPATAISTAIVSAVAAFTANVAAGAASAMPTLTITATGYLPATAATSATITSATTPSTAFALDPAASASAAAAAAAAITAAAENDDAADANVATPSAGQIRNARS
jgi:hypothetical protein